MSWTCWCLWSVLLVACGGRAETDEPQPDPPVQQSSPDLVWSIGDEHLWVISGPSQSPSGTLYVVVHITSEPDEVALAQPALTDRDPATEPPLVEMSRALMALSPAGEMLWQVELLPPGLRAAGSTVSLSSISETIFPEWLNRPQVNDDGSAWACSMVDGDKKGLHVSADGEVIGASNACSGGPYSAIGQDSTLYMPGLNTLVSISPELTVNWFVKVQLPWEFPRTQFREADKTCEWTYFGTGPLSTVIGADGLVYTSYLDSVDSQGTPLSRPEQAGLAAFDPVTGEVVRLVLPETSPSLQCEWRGLQPTAIDSDGVIYVYGQYGARLVGVTPMGERVFESSDGCYRNVIGSAGLVGVCGGGTQTLASGEQRGPTPIVLSVWEEPIAEITGLGWYPRDVVLAEPNVVLFRSSEHGPLLDSGAGVSAVDMQRNVFAGLSAVDMQGNVLWQYHGEPLADGQLVLPGDGVVYAVTESRKLIAVKAPVQGIDQGPWPMPGGNLGGTNRARTR